MVMKEKKGVCDCCLLDEQTDKLYYKVMSPTFSMLQSKIITQVKSEKLSGKETDRDFNHLILR